MGPNRYNNKLRINLNDMKRLTEAQVDDLLKLKFGKVVTEPGHTAYVSNAVLGKIFGIPT